MAEQRQFICITCPVGCTIQATVEGKELISLEGQTCSRGVAFVREELTDPRRMLTTTVRVRGGTLPLVPVRSSGPLPKERIFDVVEKLRDVVLQADDGAEEQSSPNPGRQILVKLQHPQEFVADQGERFPAEPLHLLPREAAVQIQFADETRHLGPVPANPIA